MEIPQNKKWVYLYNTKDTTHPYTGKLMVDKDAPIMAGQTDLAVPDEDKKYYFNEVTKQWVDQVVLTYEIKADKRLGAITRRPAGYVLQSNETFTKPKDGLYDPQWNGSDWVGISAEDYYKQHPVEPAKPSAQQTAMVALGQQVGNLIVENQTLKTQLEKSTQATQALGELVAPLIAKQNASQGGN